MNTRDIKGHCFGDCKDCPSVASLMCCMHSTDGGQVGLSIANDAAMALIKRMASRETDRGGCLDIVSWLLESDRIAALDETTP